MDWEKFKNNCMWAKTRNGTMLTLQRREYKKPRNCAYCEKDGHKLSEWKTVACVSERRLKLSEKKLSFNCTRSKHKASKCRSTKTCQFCNEIHHTFICKKGSNMLSRTNTSHVTFPVVVIEVEGVKCRVLID